MESYGKETCVGLTHRAFYTTPKNYSQFQLHLVNNCTGDYQTTALPPVWLGKVGEINLAGRGGGLTCPRSSYSSSSAMAFAASGPPGISAAHSLTNCLSALARIATLQAQRRATATHCSAHRLSSMRPGERGSRKRLICLKINAGERKGLKRNKLKTPLVATWAGEEGKRGRKTHNKTGSFQESGFAALADRLSRSGSCLNGTQTRHGQNGNECLHVKTTKAIPDVRSPGLWARWSFPRERRSRRRLLILAVSWKTRIWTRRAEGGNSPAPARSCPWWKPWQPAHSPPQAASSGFPTEKPIRF